MKPLRVLFLSWMHYAGLSATLKRVSELFFSSPAFKYNTSTSRKLKYEYCFSGTENGRELFFCSIVVSTFYS